MINRLAGALVRAVLVMVLVATPSILLSGVGADGKQIVALVALFAGVLTFVEYNSVYPGLVEFRDAPPFNRMRFLMLFAMVFLLSVIARGEEQPTTLTILVQSVGGLIGKAMDFPYCPVRLATLVIGESATDGQVGAGADRGRDDLSDLAGVAGGLRDRAEVLGWPSRGGAFNVWVNLPTFDPTAGGDVVDRLDRDARVNLALGFLLPFLIPAVVEAGTTGFEPLTFTSPQTLIWTMAAWAFLPACLFMRGIAMGRIADMIREKRRLNGISTAEGYIAA